MLKNKVLLFNSLKYKVQEFGYFGCEGLDLQFPLSNLNSYALYYITRNNKNILGVKSKYNIVLQNKDENKLKNLANYDILEDIKLYDENDKEINFDIIICNNIDGTCQISEEKTILIFSGFSYKILVKDKDIKDIYVKANGYYFNNESRKMLFARFIDDIHG